MRRRALFPALLRLFLLLLANGAATQSSLQSLLNVSLSGWFVDLAPGDTKTLTVTLDRALATSESATVQLRLAEYAKRGEDYTLSCASATGVQCDNFGSGTPTITFTGVTGASHSATITLTALDDGDAVRLERAAIYLGGPYQRFLRWNGLVRFHILPPGMTGRISVDLTGSRRGEYATYPLTVVYFHLRPAPAMAVSFKACLSGTATYGTDYELLDSARAVVSVGADECASLSFAAGTSALLYRLRPKDDTVDELDETVTITLARHADTPSGITPSSTPATLTIQDDDWPPSTTVSKYTTTKGLAVADDDAAPAACALPPDDLVRTVRGSYEGNKNCADRGHGENWRRVLIAFGAETRATLTPYTAAEARADEAVWDGWTPVRKELERIEECAAARTTTPPPPPPPPEISIAAGAGVTEGAAATFTLTATPAPAADLTVDVTMTEAGGYAAAGTQQVTIPTSGTAVLSIATTGDEVDEPDGSATAVLSAGAGYTVSTTAGAASVAVTDNDASGALSMSIHDAEGPEGGKLAFRVTLSRPAPDRVQAYWITSRKGGTATEGVDFAFGVGRVAFAVGVELGGGIAWADAKLGLSLDLAARMLMAHDDAGLEDRGVTASLAFDPDGASARGLSLSLSQDFGGQARGGLDALFQPEPLEDRSGSEASSRWAAEAAYGLPVFGGRFTGSPHMGLGLSSEARDYTLGWRLTPEGGASAFSFDVRAARRESESAGPEHMAGFELTARW